MKTKRKKRKKHHCHDCRSCQWCTDSRCAVCRGWIRRPENIMAMRDTASAAREK